MARLDPSADGEFDIVTRLSLGCCVGDCNLRVVLGEHDLPGLASCPNDVPFVDFPSSSCPSLSVCSRSWAARARTSISGVRKARPPSASF